MSNKKNIYFNKQINMSTHPHRDRAGLGGTCGEGEQDANDYVYNTAPGIPTGCNSDNPAHRVPPLSDASATPPPADDTPPTPPMTPPVPGSPESLPSSDAESSTDDNAALSQSASSTISTDLGRDPLFAAGVSTMGESSQLDSREKREGQVGEVLPDPGPPGLLPLPACLGEQAMVRQAGEGYDGP